MSQPEEDFTAATVATALRPSAEHVAISEYEFGKPTLNIKILNSGVDMPPRYGRAELTLARIEAKLDAGKEPTDEEKKWVDPATAKGSDGRREGTMRKILDKHYDLIFWKSNFARRMKAEALRNVAHPNYTVTVADASGKQMRVIVKRGQKTAMPGGGQTQ